MLVPVKGRPKLLQTTLASLESQLSSHTVPHTPLMQISTLPSLADWPPASWIVPWVQPDKNHRLQSNLIAAMVPDSYKNTKKKRQVSTATYSKVVISKWTQTCYTYNMNLTWIYYMFTPHSCVTTVGIVVWSGGATALMKSLLIALTVDKAPEYWTTPCTKCTAAGIDVCIWGRMYRASYIKRSFSLANAMHKTCLKSYIYICAN